jgi:hypothetical protein
MRKFTVKKFLLILLTVVLLISFSLYRSKPTFSSASHVVISEVQVSGGGETSVTTDEFIELYNPTEVDIDITGWKLMKKTAADSAIATLIATLPTGSQIKSHGFFLIAHANYDGSVTADLIYSDDQFSTNNTVILTDPTENVIDKVGMGTAADFEGGEADQVSVPAANRSIERKALETSTAVTMSSGGADEFSGNGYDTNNNKADFVYRTLAQGTDPQNSSSPVEPSGAIATPTETATPTGLLSPTPTSTPSATEAAVVINEVAWSGTTANSNHEWIELYNTTSSAIDLTGWTLKALDQTPDIALSGLVPGHGYFLLERTSDETISDIAADQTYSGALADSGESLELRNTSSQLIDTANSDGGGWPAGDASEKKSMERINPSLPDSDDNWATNNGVTINGKGANNEPIWGTPKAQNSVYIGISPTTGPTPTATPVPTSQPTFAPTTTPIPTNAPTPTTSPSVVPTGSILPSPTLSPTPTPKPALQSFVIGSFNFPGRTIICKLEFSNKTFLFGFLRFPKINCSVAR